MGRLIPLVLNQTAETTSKRFSSNPPSEPPAFGLPPIPIRSKKRRPGPVTNLTIVPYTSTEWRKAMAEVKELYDKRQYKKCSTQCKLLFDNIKDSYEIPPLYSIYIAFYAGSCLELTARSLHNNASTKLPLFKEALDFYEKAESYIQDATLTADPHTSKHNSTSSSIRSSTSSVFSQQSISSASSTASSILDSPNSESSAHHHQSQSRHTKKKVSFSSMKPVSISEPDADDDDEGSLLDSFPSPPSHDCTSSPITSSQATSTTTAEEKSNLLALEAKARERALALIRYQTHLFALSTQLTYHTTSIHAQMDTLSLAHRARCSTIPDSFSSSSSSSGAGVVAEEEEMKKKTDLQERIRRGRETGWARKRFEGGRYRELCERALGEVEGVF